METLKSVALGVLVIDKAVSHISSKYQQSFLKKIISPGSKLGHYPDIGKEVRDLLYADYNRGLKFSFHDDFLSGDLTKLRKKRPCVGHFAFQKSLKTATLALRIDTDSAILISSKVEAVAPGLTPGLSCILNVNVPDQNSGKIELHLLRRRVSLITSLGLFKNPTLAVSGLVGNDYWALGADVSMNTKTHDLTTLSGGFRWTGNGVIASLTVEEKGRFVKGQYYYPFSNTAIGAELSFNVARKRLSTFAFGVQNHYGPTDVKARFSNEGIACVLQQTWSSGSCFRLSVEKCSKKAPLIGVAVAFVA